MAKVKGVEPRWVKVVAKVEDRAKDAVAAVGCVVSTKGAWPRWAKVVDKGKGVEPRWVKVVDKGKGVRPRWAVGPAKDAALVAAKDKGAAGALS